MELELKNKVGIITGASRGIGAGIARTLGREGCRLILSARSTEELNLVAAEVKKAGGHAVVCTANLLQPEAAQPLVDVALKEYGRLDFIVANAGSARTGDFLKLTDSDWDDGFGLKFFGHMRLIRAAWFYLQASNGSVVILGGGAGRTPSAHSMITGAVNSALMNFTKALADRGLSDGVQVNGVNPGSVRTERWLGRLQKLVKSEGISEAEAEKRMVERGRQRRMGEPEDIAAMIAFILSKHGSYLHGAIVDVDGGRNKGL